MMRMRFNIDVRVNNEAIKIDTTHKVVTIQRDNAETYEESYDYLILSPGATPVKPPIDGIDHPYVRTLRNIPDTDTLKQLVDDLGSKRDVTVVGGGFIGIEMAEVLTERGLHVTLVEAASHLLKPFDSEMVKIVEQEMQERGVRLLLGESVSAFKETDEESLEVVLKSGTSYTADLVVLAIGVAPATGFLTTSGLTLGSKGHIVVNEHLQTNFDSIYAVGDAIEVVDFVSGRKTAIPLAGPANKQGRIVADHISGIQASYKGSQGTSVLKVFGLTAASTGINERTLKLNETPYKSAIVHPNSHAGYYPESTPLTLKLLFDESGTILGAQAIGKEGVDKRVDVIATVMRLGGRVSDLVELELSYAPPYSSAKDPVNMVGFVAENAISPLITVEEIRSRNLESTILLDVRSKEEFNNGHIPGAVHIPVDELRGRLN